MFITIKLVLLLLLLLLFVFFFFFFFFFLLLLLFVLGPPSARGEIGKPLLVEEVGLCVSHSLLLPGERLGAFG